MAVGPGKYDDLCTYVREHAQASAAVVIVADGKHGSGFSVQAPLEMQLALPKVLRELADLLEADFKEIVVEQSKG